LVVEGRTAKSRPVFLPKDLYKRTSPPFPAKLAPLASTGRIAAGCLVKNSNPVHRYLSKDFIV